MVRWFLTAAARTHKGVCRAYNNDSFYMSGKTLPPEAMDFGGRLLQEGCESGQLYAVCDGIGGEAVGKRAVLNAVDALDRLQQAYPYGLTDEEWRFHIAQLSDRLHKLDETVPAGVSLVLCAWQCGTLRIVNAGNSRIYRLRGSKLTQLSQDHTVVQRMVAQGALTPYQARVSPRSHLVHLYIGMDPVRKEFRPYLSPPLSVSPYDRYLLCSDGLTDMVEDSEIRHILLKSRDDAEAVDLLVQRALDNGGRDNVTTLCLSIRRYRRNPRLKRP